MLKLVLIDGNSLLNRAYYATKMLTTRAGVPTNAVFGFTKLLLKLTADLKPDRLVVAFDLKAPTFRHKMYDEYKGTRKPMPDDLAVQVPMLRSLLSSMRIAMCSKEGYEADDIIGTLAEKFKTAHSVIITGDRDAYQLVNGHTDVCITKKGVSELDRLTAENFKEKTGIDPEQVVDMKALMGDASDNIPGVAGVGEKTASSLIAAYGDLDNVYANLAALGEPLRKKLEAGRESAYLSRELARIDRHVDLAIDLDACMVRMPFSEEVREQFVQLEFTSLMKAGMFADAAPAQPVRTERESVTLTAIKKAEELAEKFCDAEKICAVCLAGNFYLSDGKGAEYILKKREDLLDDCMEEEEIGRALSLVFSRPYTFVFYGRKNMRHLLAERGVEPPPLARSEDAALLKYLLDYSGKDDDLGGVLLSIGADRDRPASGVLALYETLREKLSAEKEIASLYRDVELPLSDVLYDMECAGVKVDVQMAAEFEIRYCREIETVAEKIYAQAGERFNLNSPAQLGTVLFDKLRLPSPKKSKRGTYSTSADVLEKLKDDHEIVRDVLRCRHLQKLLSTYIEGFRPLIGTKDRLVHTTYNQVQTSTGRLSSVNPNLQNIPVRDEEGRELRKLFIARAEDRILIDADYSQIELRLLAHFSGCAELIEAYRRGEDIHALTASQVFHVPLGRVEPQMRRAAKAVNFGIIYGISDFGLASNLGISPKQAGEYIRAYFERYSDVKKYMEDNVDFARKNGFVTTLLGRKRFIAEIRSANYNIRSFGERAAMNMPLQGSSADIIKVAMLRVHGRLQKEGLRSQLILQVHDELVIDAFASEKEAVVGILREEMENAVQLRVPLVAEVHCGKNWYEAK